MIKNHKIVAVADLHGHTELFRTMLAWLDRELGSDYSLVTLGDYVDNGPDVRGLLDLLIDLRATRKERFVPIMGNHDLACVLSMGWNGAPPSEAWCRVWASRYWNAGLGTPLAYGVHTGQELAAAMPAAHRSFLQSLPWFHELGEHVFVHAGLHEGPVAPQLEELARREPLRETFLHDQLRDKRLAIKSDSAWGRVVVSGHTYRPGNPHFVTKNRITISSEADHIDVLWGVILPERRFIKVDAEGKVKSYFFRAGFL